jgi:DNA ligase (NAD+)
LLSRGDGKKGQDVTQATSSIHNIPTSLPSLSIENVDSNLPAPIIEVRGEVVLLNNDFSQISSNQNLTYSFSNSRNAASGILLRKPSHHPEEQVEAERLQSLLKFYAYDLVEGTAEESLDGIQNRNLLEHFNFDVAQPHCLTELSITNVTKDDFCTPPDAENMIQFYKALDLHRQDKASSVSMAKQFRFLDFDMDGCVHKLVDPQLKKAMGGSNKSPNWAVAHKFSPVAVVTGLVDVIVQVGRTGALTPVALLEPVTVGGVNISRATLHNFGHLQEILGDEKSLPVNTSVMVRRAGDVIPQVVGRIKSEDNDKKSDKEMISLKAPTHCPACGSKVVWEESNQPSNNRTTGQVVRCGGPPLLCRPQAITSIAHAFSRDALDLTGLSEARIQQLMDVELLRFPCDLFNFSEEDWENMEELPGWGAKSVENLRSSTKEVASHGISLNRFVYSLGIRQIGKHSSELVASSYGTIEAFLEAVQNASEWRDPQEEEPSDVEKDSNNDDNSSTHPFSKMQGRLGIGPVLINSLLSFSKKRELVKAATDLGQAINVLTEYTEVEMQAEMARSSDKNELKPFQGFRVVFTGSIPSLTRSAAQKAAKEFLGAKATPGSVSKTTDLVVHGETGGKKLQQALYFGIRTMTGNEFLELLEENGAEKQ